MQTIKAKNNGYLTQNKVVEISERLLVREVSGANINEDAWREATAKEIADKRAYEEAEEAKFKMMSDGGGDREA